MNLSRSIAASVIWGKVLRVADFLFGFGFSVLVVRRLGKETFGEYTNLDIIISIGIFVSSLGLAEAAASFLPQARAKISERFARNVFLSLNLLRLCLTIGLIGLFLLCSHLLADWLNVPDIENLALLMATLFFFRSVWEALDSHFNATLLWWRGLVAKSLAQITQFAAVVPLFILLPPIPAVLIAQILGVAVSIVVYLWVARFYILRPPGATEEERVEVQEDVRVLAAVDGGDLVYPEPRSKYPLKEKMSPNDSPLTPALANRRGEGVITNLATNAASLPDNPPPAAISRQELKEMYRYTFTIWLISIFTFGLANFVDILLVQYILQVVEITGYYRLAINLAMTLQSIVIVWGRTFLPTMADIESREGRVGMRRAIIVFHKINLMLVLPVMAGLVVVAPNLIATAYGEAFLPAAPLTAIYALFLLLFNMFGNGINLFSLYVLKKQHIVLWERMFFGTLNVVMDIFLIPVYGPLGAVFSTGLCSLCVVLIEYWLLSHELKFQLPWRFLFKLGSVTATAALSSSLVFLLNFNPGLIPLILQTGIFGGVFFAGLRLIHLLEPEDKAALANTFARRPQYARFINKVLAFF